jgi:hypothetical protein
MKQFVFATVSLIALSGVALAEPTKLSTTQMDAVTAGDLISVGGVFRFTNIPVSTSVGGCAAVAVCTNGAGRTTTNQNLTDLAFIVNSNLIRVRIRQ